MQDRVEEVYNNFSESNTGLGPLSQLHNFSKEIEQLKFENIISPVYDDVSSEEDVIRQNDSLKYKKVI